METSGPDRWIISGQHLLFRHTHLPKFTHLPVLMFDLKALNETVCTLTDSLSVFVCLCDRKRLAWFTTWLWMLKRPTAAWSAGRTGRNVRLVPLRRCQWGHNSNACTQVHLSCYILINRSLTFHNHLRTNMHGLVVQHKTLTIIHIVLQRLPVNHAWSTEVIVCLQESKACVECYWWRNPKLL